MTRYEFLGTTDESTACDHCGRTDLKKTVMLFTLDADGVREKLVYYGTSCAARALSLTNTQVSRAAGEAEIKRQRRMWELRTWLMDMDPAGRFPTQTRRLWMDTTKWGGTFEIDGIPYGPECGEGRMFLGFAIAIVAKWTAELEQLQGTQ